MGTILGRPSRPAVLLIDVETGLLVEPSRDEITRSPTHWQRILGRIGCFWSGEQEVRRRGELLDRSQMEPFRISFGEEAEAQNVEELPLVHDQLCLTHFLQYVRKLNTLTVTQEEKQTFLKMCIVCKLFEAPVHQEGRDPVIQAAGIHPYSSLNLRDNRGRLPRNVDRQNLEMHLSNEEFFELFNMRKSDYIMLQTWKQRELKKTKFLY